MVRSRGRPSSDSTVTRRKYVRKILLEHGLDLGPTEIIRILKKDYGLVVGQRSTIYNDLKALNGSRVDSGGDLEADTSKFYNDLIFEVRCIAKNEKDNKVKLTALKYASDIASKRVDAVNKILLARQQMDSMRAESGVGGGVSIMFVDRPFKESVDGKEVEG